MPEFKDDKRALPNISGGGGSGGFFIRRVASPGALAVRGAAGKQLARRFISPSNNKENLPPVWAVRATPPKRRSPLPGWYPRTPLRDITAIAKAIQRSRLRIAAAQQQSQRPEQSPQSVNVTTPAQAEQDNPHSTEASLTVASGSGSNERETVASPETILADDNLKVCSPPAGSSLKTPFKPIDPALADIVEKKLSSSIDQIEKMVKKNMKRTPKAAQPSKRAIQRRNLMSMR
ncbi:protein POLYCHOME-like [Phragmites australis]|uniref:protein POLYCHOME-like n=1 Tax=Phragmites australis TaxID=29695 RepID=UPI002D77971E|nr:protein POLYCHOME-like [Phragmites australis]XP_062183711.1 protein POLYCHOME-like [Phragmites australis]